MHSRERLAQQQYANRTRSCVNEVLAGNASPLRTEASISKETGPARVLGIDGSPRKGGNTETLADAVLAGAREARARR